MYIKKVVIENIRSISHFEMEFPKPAGWHVLIGDNGSGKTTILKAIGMGLIGPEEVLRLDPDWESLVKKGKDGASIKLECRRADNQEVPEFFRNQNVLKIELSIKRNPYRNKFALEKDERKVHEGVYPDHVGKNFCVGFGPFRRFTGGDPAMSENGKITPITPFNTLFREGAVLSSTLAWIKDQHLRELEGDPAAKRILEGLKSLISSKQFLPNRLIVDEIKADGVFFQSGDGKILHINDLSDGSKTVLALLIELVRLILNVYPVGEVFNNSDSVPVSGVVLIDEIDAHLHPTWQTRIGHWFTQYFPNLQFIVTTHSPLICRACEKGSIWRLAAPGSEALSGEITGIDKDRLIYGNILDAYGTEVFGSDPVRSKQSHDKLERLGRLNMLSVLGKIKPEEEKERRKLQKILATDDPTGF